MKKIINNYWLFFIIATQPILDIIAYFTFDDFLTPFSFIMRSLYLLFIIVFTFFKTRNKKNYILTELPFIIFSCLHLMNSIRTSGLNIFDDLRYLILVMQMPIITISIIYYLKDNKEQLDQIKKGFQVSFIFIAIAFVLSVLTNSYKLTYESYGVTGWYTSANTQSMILSCLIPYTIYLFSKKQTIYYLASSLISFVMLFFNGTKACYLTLFFSLIVLIYTNICDKNNLKKLIITLILFILSSSLYSISTTSLREEFMDSIEVDKITELEILSQDNLTKEEVINFYKQSYLYEQLMVDLGEDDFYEAIKDNVSSSSLVDNRMVKRTYAKIIFKNSDLLTKLVGFNHFEIQKYHMDLENDITALFYYYGYIGFGLFLIFILYFVYRGLRLIYYNHYILFNGEFIILCFGLLLSLFGSEFSGALLRKPNANIYFSLLLVCYYFAITKNVNKKNISFLALHLGYGGIETSLINQANTLKDKFNVKIISFYNLSNNQSNKIDSKVKIKYLLNYGPNKEEFIKAINDKKFINILKEGLKSVYILFLKRYLIIKSIMVDDSKYIVSTRKEFSKLLSKYGSNETVRIAQEHQYHNNDKKYLKTIKNYKNIDYLFALTEVLKNDYEKIVNKKTKVVLMPNMLYTLPDTYSKLDTNNIITVSRLDYGKRVNEIIDIVSKTKYNLFIIGDGKEYENLKKQITNNKLEDRIFLVGYKNQSEIKEYMLKSNLFLMASISEGLPMVLLEAMSYGVPCIAFETVSGVNDIIRSNYNGYVIKNRDEEEYLDKINKVMVDSKLRKKLGTNAIKTSKLFSKEEIYIKMKKIYK